MADIDFNIDESQPCSKIFLQLILLSFAISLEQSGAATLWFIHKRKQYSYSIMTLCTLKKQMLYTFS